MKKSGFLLILTFVVVNFSSCLSDQSKGEKLIRNYMFSTAYDYDSYEPIETNVAKSNKTIWYNLRAISVAKQIVQEYKDSYSSFSAIDKNDTYNVYVLIKKHLEEFGNYDSLESDAYDGYSVTQKFRIKSRNGVSQLMEMRYIVDNEFSRIITSYSMYEIDRISEAYILAQVHDVFRLENKRN